MDIHLDEIGRFLDGLRARHAPILPAFGDRKVASFMATSSSPGLPPSVSIHRTESIVRDPERGEPVAALRGPLPRGPGRGELVAASVTDAAAFRGFQLKTHTLVDPAFASRLLAGAAGGVRLRTPNVFTIHHGPHAANFFEQVPLDEVAEVAARAGLALVAVGESANLSPRWVFHHEVLDGALHLFQGDAMWSKTYLNVRRNPRENRIVIDLESGEGFVLEGEIAEFEAEEHPLAAGRILAAFAGAGLKRPTRLYRLRVDAARRIAPTEATAAAT